MKKIDKLVFGSFIGPFLLTLVVVDFILLLVTLLKYFDQIMGKGLSFGVFAELIFYFSVSSSPDAFPLAVLLSSIMTFGNLGEHSELTAVKSSGISLIRTLVPIFIFVLFLTGFTYYSNTNLVPKTNLKTYSLLWDMRTKKPALDIKEGVFYDGIPGYTIKVNEKVDDERLKDIIIYDHQDAKAAGNKVVMLADSGRMYSFKNQRYMVLELFNGGTYRELENTDLRSRQTGGKFTRDLFKSSKLVFDLSSFDMNDTDEKLFRRSRLVQTRNDLEVGIDSMQRDLLLQRERIFRDVANTFKYHYIREAILTPEVLIRERMFHDSLRTARQLAKTGPIEEPVLTPRDSLNREAGEVITTKTTIVSPKGSLGARDSSQAVLAKAGVRSTTSKSVGRSTNTNVPIKRIPKQLSVEESWEKFEEHFKRNRNMTSALVYAQNNVRAARNLLNTRITSLQRVKRDQNKFVVTKNQQMARSFACLIMFLIGAPIGAIIKKGGIGLPVVVSIVFFLVFYILNTIGEKWGKEGILDPTISVWISNAILLPFGLFFLQKARHDARIFESDFYAVWWRKVRDFFHKKKTLQST